MYLNLSWNSFFKLIDKNDVFFSCFLMCLFLGCIIAIFFFTGLFFNAFFIVWQRFFLYLYFFLFILINCYAEEFFLVMLIFWILCFFVRRLTFVVFYAQSNFSINLSLVIGLLLLCWKPFQYLSYFYIYQSVLPLDCFYLHQDLCSVLFFSISIAQSVLNNLLILNMVTVYFKMALTFLLLGIYLLLFIDSFWSWAGIRLINWNLFAILLCLTVFGILLILSNDLTLIFLNLIGLNIVVYSLIISENFNKRIIEASLKYFFLSTISSLFFIGGLMLLFAVWKTTNLSILSLATQYTSVQSMVECMKYMYGTSLAKNTAYSLVFIDFFWQNKLLGVYLFYVMFFLFVSFIFKLALFPLHSWAAEVYSTFSIRMLFIFIVFLKGIFFIKFIHIFIYALNSLAGDVSFLFNGLFFCVVFGSVFVGSITALFEDKIKKIIAFSSTNQLGFVFAGLLINNSLCLSNMFCLHVFNGLLVSFLFLFVYLISMFLLLFFLSIGSVFSQRLKFITDVAHVNFSILVCIMLLFFSFAGLPPLAGFFIKFYVLSHLWQSGFVWFTFGIILLSVVGCYYYLRVIKTICFDLSSIWLLKRKAQFLFSLFQNDVGFSNSLYYFMFVLKFLMYGCFVLLFFLFFFPIILSFLVYLLEPFIFMLLLWIV